MQGKTLSVGYWIMSREAFDKIPEIKELIDTYDFTYSSRLNKYVGFPDDEELRINKMWSKYQTEQTKS